MLCAGFGGFGIDPPAAMEVDPPPAAAAEGTRAWPLLPSRVLVHPYHPFAYGPCNE